MERGHEMVHLRMQRSMAQTGDTDVAMSSSIPSASSSHILFLSKSDIIEYETALGGSRASNTLLKLTLIWRRDRFGSNTVIIPVEPCPTDAAACDGLCSSQVHCNPFGDWEIHSNCCA